MAGAYIPGYQPQYPTPYGGRPPVQPAVKNPDGSTTKVNQGGGPTYAPTTPYSGVGGAGAVMHPDDQMRFNREAAERSAKEKQQADFDQKWLDSRGQMGGGTPSMEAIARLKALLGASPSAAAAAGANGGAGHASASSSSSGGADKDAKDQFEFLKLQAELTRQAELRRWEMIKSMGGFGGNVPQVSPTDFSGANDAAFARAKDMIGLQQRAALNSLRDYYSNGRSGSMRSAGEAALSGGLDQLGEVSRDQAIAGAERSADIADRNYQGEIAQRAQNMQYMQQLLGLLNARAY